MGECGWNMVPFLWRSDPGRLPCLLTLPPTQSATEALTVGLCSKLGTLVLRGFEINLDSANVRRDFCGRTSRVNRTTSLNIIHMFATCLLFGYFSFSAFFFNTHKMCHLNQVKFPVLYSRFSLVIYSVYTLIPVSQFIPPLIPTLVSICLFSTSVSIFSLQIRTSIPFLWRRQWQPTPILLPGKSHGRRSLVGCSPWCR